MTLKQAQPAFWANLIVDHYAALGVFFRRRIVRISEAEDLVQEVYWRFLRRGEGHSEGAGIQNPEAYLFTVAENLLREHRTAQRRSDQHVELSEVAPSLLSVEDAAESTVDRSQLDQRLAIVFSRLTARQRVVFVMHYRDGMTYPEIAEKLGVSTSMVKKYIVKGLAACRSGMAVHQGGE
jgi:RNA polymerase sigma factor (sigma-70 family)